jgi:hypothetical protein
MSASQPRLVTTLLAVAVFSLTACSSGSGTAASEPYPADGVNAQSGSIRILNALVVEPAQGGDGVLLMTVVNDGSQPEVLTSLTTSTGTIEYTGSKQIAAGQAVHFGVASDPSVTIRGLTTKPGGLIPIRFDLARTEPINLLMPALPATAYYSTITPQPTPSGEPSDSSPPASGTATPSDTTPAPIASASTS